MSKAALSVYIFSLYLLVLGLVLLLFPNVLLAHFGIQETTEVWISVVGKLVLILGFYYTTAAKSDLTPFLRATVIARFSVLVFFVAFVVVGWAPVALILFGVIDAVAATWTAVALRQ